MPLDRTVVRYRSQYLQDGVPKNRATTWIRKCLENISGTNILKTLNYSQTLAKSMARFFRFRWEEEKIKHVIFSRDILQQDNYLGDYCFLTMYRW
jgi:hypothetical protein